MSDIALTLSERDFCDQVIALAYLRGWRVAHFRPAQTSKGWRTPMQGHVGFPDLVLARDGRVLIRELKRHGGRLSPMQKDWLTHLGETGGLWTPTDWTAINKELA